LLAVINGDQHMLAQLLETFTGYGKTIDVNKKNSVGKSPLHLCAENNLPKLMHMVGSVLSIFSQNM